ncbi:cell division protein YlmG/Ycf19 [Desulfocucumis palustris]|uniref:Cell division protein YlmG/Ycf19 n=1 Tax=Desulfocucumis palustris TaxID=1898651 RepID=A0A2L2XBC1_9FIRM|nr:YggT family protein [Desulfocucumis palustris]GBF33284.1 cell division protein YlmG/Ycf19 [Desulfocucumis palustris]
MNLEYIVNIIFQVYIWLIFARIILSWVRHNPYQPVIRFIYEVTEPVLGFFRRIIPPIGVVDISPIAAFFALELLNRLIIQLLRMLGL